MRQFTKTLTNNLRELGRPHVCEELTKFMNVKQMGPQFLLIFHESTVFLLAQMSVVEVLQI